MKKVYIVVESLYMSRDMVHTGYKDMVLGVFLKKRSAKKLVKMLHDDCLSSPIHIVEKKVRSPERCFYIYHNERRDYLYADCNTQEKYICYHFDFETLQMTAKTPHPSYKNDMASIEYGFVMISLERKLYSSQESMIEQASKIAKSVKAEEIRREGLREG